MPVLGEGFQETLPTRTASGDAGSSELDADGKKRHFWQFGKKKDDKKRAADAASSSPPPGNPQATLRSTSPRPTNPSSPKMMPASPNRMPSSPRVISPASSMIFERNVQEDVDISTASSAIPAHMATDNHIPPVLDASSIAITDDHLTPDNVEIVTHAAHQPASVAVTAATTEHPPLSAALSHDEPSFPSPVPHTVFGTLDALSSDDPSSSNYGTLDATDVRRLSFISFADVVHAEQGDHASMRESMYPTSSPTAAGARSPSPMRSPISPQLSAASASGSPRFGAVDGGSPPQRLGSPRIGAGLGLSAGLGGGEGGARDGGELSIQTMRQALRKTGSGDLSGARSASGEDGEMERLF